MRARGEGSISQRKDGRWMARFYITCPDGTRKRQHIFKKTKSEALAAMRDELRLAAFGSPVVRDGRKVGDYLDYWLQYLAPNKVRKTTLIGYEATVRNHIKPVIGDKTLLGLSPADVQAMINRHMKNGGSARLAQIIRNVLSAALHAAVNRQILHRNVARLVDVPQDVHKERGFWSPEECGKFLDSIKDHRFYPIFEIYFTFGMRRGEALGLRWCDVDFEEKVIHVRQQVVQMGKHIFIAEPKTENSKRKLPLLPHIGELLLKQRRKEPKAWPEALIFHSSTGTPYQPNNVFRYFKKKIRELGLPEISIHDIRHTVATMMKDNDVPVKDAQMTLGHASPTTTMQHYQHSSLDKKNKALSAISKNIRQAVAL